MMQSSLVWSSLMPSSRAWRPQQGAPSVVTDTVITDTVITDTVITDSHHWWMNGPRYLSAHLRAASSLPLFSVRRCMFAGEF
jgi:hypothetical protein